MFHQIVQNRVADEGDIQHRHEQPPVPIRQYQEHRRNEAVVMVEGGDIRQEQPPVPIRQHRQEDAVVVGVEGPPIKFWKGFFIIQSFSIIFLLDIALGPSIAYSCNPFKGLSWDYKNAEPYREERNCHGKITAASSCWIKEENCYRNCQRYQEFLYLLQNPSSKIDAEQYYTFNIYPNPLCFFSPAENTKLSAKDYRYYESQVFIGKKKRAAEVEAGRRVAYFWNYLSFFMLIVWAFIYCANCASEENKQTRFLLVSMSIIFYWIGNYIAFSAIIVLKCYHRTIIPEDEITTLNQTYQSFCDDTIEVNWNDKNGTSFSKIVQLPPLPSSWSYPYYILVFRSTLTVVYLFVWIIYDIFGRDFIKCRYIPYIGVGIIRFWNMMGH